ncbi:hypothetical protein VNO78_05746 [Psophocarpus tetragonolobus]|uniref:Carboxypeptidase n=1 Tax=Psophocarpus tetragonolobus TaxID=3891 RepID=A0AAN9T176_PSOTE
MGSSPTLSKVSVLLVFVFFVPLCSSSNAPPGFTGNRVYQPQPHAEKLIRSLNLFPEQAVNVIKEGLQSFVPGVIVEKNFSFLPRSADQDLAHHAGYYSLPHSKAANKDDPVVIWLSGGPGCGSEIALFYENGPFHITNNLTLTWNDYGWDQASNILFIDQPTGTGFSYSSDASDIRHDEESISIDLYDFLQEFFKAHPQLVKNDFYITGESYSGHYIPALASRVNQGNKRKEGIHINLKGFAIGDGLTNSLIQYRAYPDFAFRNGLIKKANYDYYDIRKKCEGNLCYDFNNLETLLNLKTVKSALGVANELKYVSCSTTVYDAMLQDWMRNFDVGIPALLEDGIKLLVYVGEKDLICNWLGNLRWVQAMKWSGQKAFVKSPTLKFMVDGAEAGSLNSYGPLTFLKVHEAGHLVPMDQPKAALQMLKSWMAGNLTKTE